MLLTTKLWPCPSNYFHLLVSSTALYYNVLLGSFSLVITYQIAKCLWIWMDMTAFTACFSYHLCILFAKTLNASRQSASWDGILGLQNHEGELVWFQAYVVVSVRYSRFWDVVQHILVVSYRSFGRNYRPHLQGSSSPSFLLDCVTLEDGADSLSRNDCN